jgi:hypothetical protein
MVGAVRPATCTPTEHALSRRFVPSAKETSNRCGRVGAPTFRASDGGMIVWVAPVSTRKRAIVLRRADTVALTDTWPTSFH